MRRFEYIIHENEENQTILQFLKNHNFSRGVITALKKTENGILKNDVWAYVNEKLHKNDSLTLILKETEFSENIIPINFPLSIIYEDEDIFVINKPAGMPIHPSINHYDHTLANALAFYCKDNEEPFVFRCINRLDRDTSGLTIVAKHLMSSGILGNMIKERRIHREYLGIADGFLKDSGTIDAPIARKDDSVIERAVNFENGERAITHYQRLAYKNGLSLASFVLETGRTHQIRVHMKYNNTPLIGDFLYHPKNHQMARQALHAWKLSFEHPVTGEEMHFTAPIPKDFILTPENS